MNSFRLYILFVFFCGTIFAQNQDSVLNYSNYIDKVLSTHPLAKVADLKVDQAKANLLKAKGNFDPYIAYQYNGKQFQDVDYYQIHEGKLIVPTGLGPNLSLGYERAQGTYLNSQHNLPADGLLNLGIDIALLQGFWTDESRTLLRQAKASRAVAAVEKQLVLNRLILEATQQYWYWFEAWNKLKVQEKGVKLALERFNGVVESANLGDAPMIDTVEAKIQVQNRMVNYEEFFAQYKINQIELGFYLWEDSLNFVNKNLPPFYAFFDEATLPDFNLDV